MNFSEYLLIPYILCSGEITIFIGAIIGSGLGFLWFNTYPAQVFMGDVGALALGAALGYSSNSKAGSSFNHHGWDIRIRSIISNNSSFIV